MEGLHDGRVHLDHEIVVSRDLVVALILLILGPVSKVVTSYRVHNVDKPLAWEVVMLFGIRQVLLHLWVVGGLL